MFRFSTPSLALSLLPILAVPGVLSLTVPHGYAASPATEDTRIVYIDPSPMTDSIHVRQLARLLQTIRDDDRRSGPFRSLHPNLTAEYRLIVHETTPGSIRRVGLPFDVR